MKRSQHITTRIQEFLGISHPSPSDSHINRVTHSLVHADAMRASKEHGDKFKAALRDKGLPKSHIEHIVSRARRDAYNRHYRKLYVGTKREVSKEMYRD